MNSLPRRRMLAFGGFAAVLAFGLGASPAFAYSSLLLSLANTPTPTSACSPPSLSQAFAAAGDSNWYTLVPGEAADSFGGQGWTLAGGAGILTTRLADGNAGTVLNLPSGAVAISPPVCVNSGYAVARTQVQDVVGSEGVSVYVSYAGTSTWRIPKNTGQVHGQHANWTLSDPVNLQPGNAPGWQLMRFAFVPGGNSSDFRIYDFYVDPRMTR